MGMLTSVRLRKFLTFGLWCAGLVLATALLMGRPTGDAQGVAWGTSVQLSAPEDGTLTELAVALHQIVEEGDLLARIDPAPLLLRAEILNAELKALGVSESEDSQSRNRRFQTDREDARLEQARLRASVAEEEVRLAAMEAELAREQRLVDEGLRPPAIADDLRRQADVIRTRIEAEKDRMAVAQQTVQSASSRAATASGPNRWQITAAERRLDEVYQRLERLELRSTIDGQITELEGAPGEWFKAGQPVVRVSADATRTVHVWTDASVAKATVVGAPASVRTASGDHLTGVVQSAAVERQALPASLWYRPDIREWGYLVRLELDSDGLTAGEPVRVSL